MNPTGLIIIAATTLAPAVQLCLLPDITDQTALVSQFLGMAALILMAWTQFLAARPRGVEAVFGGLDRIYILHKWAGILAMAALLFHDTIDADMRGLGRPPALNDLAESLGEFSLYGLLLLVAISLATFVPYHLWKWSHKAMGALFAMGALHFFLIQKPFAMTDPVGLYTGTFCMIGILAYAWVLLPSRLRPSHSYTVAGIEKTGGALAITMAPSGRGLRPSPGQFGVLSFTGTGLGEPHPFSFSGIGPDGTLRVTIKALGDFTTSLHQKVRVGDAVRVQGPYGRFRNSNRPREVWVAGGIGVTPFVAWAHALNDNGGQIDLFYCVRTRAEAPHLGELEAIAKANPDFRLHVVASGDGARLTPRMIADVVGPELARAKLSFCGPKSLRDMLQTGLPEYGVRKRRIHYEEFEFRTGIGVTRFIGWMWQRLRTAPTDRRPSVAP